MTRLSEVLRRLALEANLRFLVRRKAALGVAVSTMALALGANTAVFSVFKAFLLSSLAVPEPDRLFLVAPVRDLPGQGEVVFSDAYPNYRLLRETQRSFSEVSCVFQGSLSWDDDGEPKSLDFSRVTAGFFATMGVQPFLGRAFTGRDEGPNPAPVVVIGYALWQSAFAADASAVGRTLRLDGVPHMVLGVMPRGFSQPAPTELWLPFDVPSQFWTSITGARLLAVYGRLKPGVSRQAATADLADFTRRAVAADSAANGDYRYTLRALRQVLLGGADATILLVQLGAAALLFLAATNLASLLIAWSLERRQETAVRLALGAGGGRVARQFLAQSLVVVGLGGVLGCVLAALALPVIRQLNPAPVLASFLAGLRLDSASASFGVVLAAATGVLAAVLPAWHGARSDPALALRAASRGASLSPAALGWQRAMLLAQAGLAVVILSTAALATLSFRNLLEVPAGFDARGSLVLRLHLPEREYPSHESRAGFAEAVLDGLGRERELLAYGFTSTLPVGDVGWGGRFLFELPSGEWSTEPVLFHYRRVSDGYLGALRLPLLLGRQFERQDSTSSRGVAIVSKALADRIWPGQQAIGKRLRRVAPNSSDTVPLEVVGVVANTVDSGYDAPVGEAIYVPYRQVSVNRLSLLLRPRDSVEGALAAARRALQAADPKLAIRNVTTLETLVWQTHALPRLRMALLVTFAAIAVGITALGSYGAMTQLVLSRERDLAVRLIVGARPVELGRSVLAQNARLASTGIAAGLVVAWLAAGVMRQFVVGIEPGSPLVLALVGLGTLGLTLGAALAPAWRAARVDVRKAQQAG